MDKQNNSEVDNKQPLQDSTIQTPLNQVENIKKAGSKPPKFLVPALIGSVILIFAIGGLFLFKSNRSSHKANLTNTQQQTVPTSSEQATQTQTTLDALFASLNSTYNGNIPWTNINNRIAYKFYPKEIIGFPIAGNQLAINYDENYNPLTVFNLTESITIPLKNALAGLYEIPTVLNSKFNLSDTDYVIPLELKAYEFNRRLN